MKNNNFYYDYMSRVLGGLNPCWGAITTHSLSLKAATPQPLKKAWINQAKRLSSFPTLNTCSASFSFQPPPCWFGKCVCQSPSFICFLVKIIFWEAAIKDERFVRKGRRLGEFKARVAHIHGGPQIQGGAANLRFSWRYFYIKPLTFHFSTNEPLLWPFLLCKLVTSKILSELRVPISTSLNFLLVATFLQKKP